MHLKRLSTQSDQSVQTTSNETNGSSRWLGYKRLTLRDALELLFALLVPAMIGILAIILQKNEIDLTEKNRRNDYLIGQLQRASDEQQTRILGNETVFSTYVKNMADLILYSPTKLENQHWIVTRALTSTALRQLDSEKKLLVIQFLYDSGILKRGENIFNSAFVPNAERHLKGVNLDQVDFGGGQPFSAIILRSIRAMESSFVDSHFDASDLTQSIFSRSNFSGTILDDSRLVDTQFDGTDFTGASLKNVQLVRTNFSQSNIQLDQILQATFIFNSVLPNGSFIRNRTFLDNGDARQGLDFWNVTEGTIQVKDFSFIGTRNASMVQRIDTTDGRLLGSYESFQYCLSFDAAPIDSLAVRMDYLDRRFGLNRFEYLNSSHCTPHVNGETNLCHWSYCNDSPSGTDYIDLKFIFGFSMTTNTSIETIVTLKNIELTIFVE